MLFQPRSKETLSAEAAYSKFIENAHAEELFQKIMHDKLNWTVSELFCVEDSKSNHEQKQSSYLKKKCQLC